MTSWLLILYIGTSNGVPKYFIKPYETEAKCLYEGAQIEVAERLKGNYSVSFNCMERIK